MGGSSKKQTVGWRYFFGIHMGIGRGPVDELHEVKVGDRSVWLGTVTENTTININASDAFGGEEKEGGIQGPLEVMMGGPTQTASAGLVAMRGSDLPGFRRRVTLFFNGLIGMNNPYPKPWKFRLNRILAGWDGEVFAPHLARIGERTTSGGFSDSVHMPLLSNFTNLTEAPVEAVTNTATFTGNGLNVGPNETVTVVMGPYSYGGVEPNFVSASILVTNIVYGTLEHAGAAALAFGSAFRWKTEDQTVIAGFWFRWISPDEGWQWAGYLGDQTELTYFGGKPRNVKLELRYNKGPTDALGTIGVYADGIPIVTMPSPVDRAPDNIGQSFGDRHAFGAFQPAYAETGLDFTLSEYKVSHDPIVPYTENGFYAMNPAHIIYECLTNREWGRGLDRSRLDPSSFLAAATALYDEGFGLCMKWVRTDDIESFIQKIIDTIGAVLYVSRTTALLTLKLIRADYDPQAVPFFDPESGLRGVQESTIGTIGKSINSVSVVWHDPISDEDRRVTVNNPASLLNAGGVANSVTAEYKGIPSAALAARVAQRDLRTASTTLRRMTGVFDRRAELVEPGSVIAVRDLSRGIQTTLFRVGRVEDGTLIDGRIVLSLVQDVFALPTSAFVAEVPSIWQPPDTKPCVPAQQRAIEMPYFLVARSLTPAELDYVSEDGAFLGTMSAKGKPLNIGYRINVRSGAPEPGDFSGDDYNCEI